MSRPARRRLLLLLAPSVAALQEPHDRFRSRLRMGVKEVERRSDMLDELDNLDVFAPPSPPPPARRAPPPPRQQDVCAEDFDAFVCDDGLPCINQCTGCPDANCWLRCYDKCDKARHIDFVSEQCAARCEDQHTKCTADCEAEAATIAAAPRNLTSANKTAHPERHCAIADDSFPFDCAVPCLEQCDACSSASQCLPRCFHQCTQGSNCNKVCEKMYTGCDFTCQRLQSGSVDSLLSLFQI